MNAPNPIDPIFTDMDKLSPGDDSLSLYVLRSLPEHRFEVVVDAGCGAGRQTFVLADELKTLIHAVDSYQPFLDRFRQRAKEKGLAQLVRTHCMDMKETFRASLQKLICFGRKAHLIILVSQTHWPAGQKRLGRRVSR